MIGYTLEKGLMNNKYFKNDAFSQQSDLWASKQDIE